MSLLHDGQVIRGTYEVERLLGEGAFAEVYRVKHRFLGRQAMKVFKALGMTAEETEQMLGEAIMLSRLGHPNIIRVFDANITETSKGIGGFFTMEYIAGGSLEQFWRSHGPKFVPLETAVEVLRQVCRGMAVAHAASPPIVHRDIKPQNILVGYDAEGLRARVADFGLAKHVNPLTLLASTRGTRCFKAPEALRNLQADSRASDIWALGTTLYLLLTDRVPFPELDDMRAQDPHCLERPIIPPSRLNIQVDPVLDQVVLRTLALRPEDRYQTAKELLVELERWSPRAPGARKNVKGSGSGNTSKSALGVHSSASEDTARRLAVEALRMARDTSQFMEAADLMEEAFNKWPQLREEHEYQVKLWRRGVAM